MSLRLYIKVFGEKLINCFKFNPEQAAEVTATAPTVFSA